MALNDYRFFKNINAWFRQNAENDIFHVSGLGAPTNGTSGTGVGLLGPTSTYRDATNGIFYMNLGTKLSPFWQILFPSLSGNGGDLSLRMRVTTANVNAGQSLLPAIPLFGYRLVDIALISVGGAAAGATTVDILATQAAGSVKLLAAAVAGLTQSTVLRAGATNAAVLADGASFVRNDVNTAITISKTGGALTTSTNIDVLMSYVVEK